MIKSIIHILSIFLYLVLFLSLFSCEREISVSGPQEYEIGDASYFISTNPEGALIYVDGKNTGLYTPDTVKWLPEGEYTFLLKREPFLDYTFTDNVLKSTVNSKDYDYYADTKNFGSIKFISTPDSCIIFLDDSLLNFKTPYILRNLLPAKYKIKFTYPGYRADSISIFLYAGKQSSINLALKDTSVWVTYNTENSDISDNTINDIFIEDDNIIWIGTSQHGIIKLVNGTKTFINTSNSDLQNDRINRIEKGPNGEVWVATQAGLAKIDGDNINTFRTNNSGLPSNYISDLEFDNEGKLWIGTQSGLATYDGSSWNLYNTSNSTIPGNFISKILIDRNDTLWIGTSQFSTAKFDGVSTWTSYQSDFQEIGDAVADLIVDKDNKLWVGLVTQFSKPGVPAKPGGIFVLKNQSLVEISFNLENKRINRFFLDDDNILWIGSRSGLLKVISETNYQLFTSQTSGLPINDIISINKDQSGNLWIGTNGGGLVKYKIWNE